MSLLKNFFVKTLTVLKQKAIIFFTILLILLVVIILPNSNYNAIPSTSEYDNDSSTQKKPGAGGKTIVIDAGHGGYDPGKVGISGVLEKEINLSIAVLLKDLLEKNGFNVVMTRTSDTELCPDAASNKKTADLNARLEIIEKANPAFVLCIHQNSYPSESISGAQVFYYGENTSDGNNTSASQALATCIQNALIKEQNPKNHRKEKSNTSYYMLKKTAYPIVIIECGFLSNSAEETLLTTPEYQKKTAEAIFLGVKNYISGLK